MIYMRSLVSVTSGARKRFPWSVPLASTASPELRATTAAVVGSRKSTPAFTIAMPKPIGIMSSGSSTPLRPR